MTDLLTTVPLLLLATTGAAAGLTYLLRRWLWLQVIVAAATTAVLALLALQVPLGQAVVFAGRDVLFSDTWSMLGRAFVFNGDDRPALAFLFLVSLFVFMGAGATRVTDTFVPVGLGILALLLGALFVEPFLYAALFFVMAAAALTVILVDEEHHGTRGAFRLLVFVVLGMPFILLAGWLLEAYTSTPDNVTLLDQARTLIGIGFFILLAVVPFHSWVPSVAEDAPPFAAAFVFTVVQSAIVFYLLTFLNEFEWMRNAPITYSGLRVAGLSLVIVGGLFSFGQANMGRLMGYIVLIDLGAVLLALSLGTGVGVQTALAILGLRAAALMVWGLGLDLLKRATGSDAFEALESKGRTMPFATAAVLIGGLSLLGLPITAGFAGRWALYQQLAGSSLTATFILLAATVGGLLAFARAASIMLAEPAPTNPYDDDAELPQRENPIAMVYTGLGVGLLLLLGVFPQVVLPVVTAAASAFAALVQ